MYNFTMTPEVPVAPVHSLENRLSALEAEVATLKRNLETTPKRGWLKRFMGSADNLEGFDEAMRLGREARQNQPPPDQVPA
jgi:hypothetical protein